MCAWRESSPDLLSTGFHSWSSHLYQKSLVQKIKYISITSVPDWYLTEVFQFVPWTFGTNVIHLWMPPQTSCTARLARFLDLANCKAVQHEGDDGQMVLSEGGKGEDRGEEGRRRSKLLVWVPLIGLVCTLVLTIFQK